MNWSEFYNDVLEKVLGSLHVAIIEGSNTLLPLLFYPLKSSLFLIFVPNISLR